MFGPNRVFVGEGRATSRNGQLVVFDADLCCSSQQLLTSEKPLVGEALVRGAYVNSGSKDVGPDRTARPN